MQTFFDKNANTKLPITRKLLYIKESYRLVYLLTISFQMLLERKKYNMHIILVKLWY